MAEKSSMLSEKMHQMCGGHLFYTENHLWCEATHSKDAGKAGLSFLASTARVGPFVIQYALKLPGMQVKSASGISVRRDSAMAKLIRYFKVPVPILLPTIQAINYFQGYR